MQVGIAIQDVRDFCGKAWTEYREQAPMHEIMRMSTLLPILLAHIDEQSSKIATLKAALVADREELIVNGSSYVIWRYQNNIDPIDPNWGLIKSHAKEELAQEYPDIDWEE